MQPAFPGRGAVEGELLVAVPVEREDLVEPMRRLVCAAKAAKRSCRGSRAVDYSSIERSMSEECAKIEPASHASILHALEVDAKRVMVPGRLPGRSGHAADRYSTLAGALVIERAVNRPAGERNARAVDAISLRAGVVGRGWLPNTAQATAHFVQSNTSREAETIAAEMGRLPHSRASFERLAHEMGERWIQEHADIEDALIQQFPGKVTSKRPDRDAITYVANHLHLMESATARKERLPIGSGNIAATCKTPITLRMKRLNRGARARPASTSFTSARWH